MGIDRRQAVVASHPLRYPGDVARAHRLCAAPEVEKARAAMAMRGAVDVRRGLLGSALRLSSLMAPAIVALVESCRQRLEVATPVEVYVYPSPQFNAGCTAPDAERVYVLLSSALVDGFAAAELKFVIGHELGHHLFAHHEIPAHDLLANDEAAPPALALELYAWQRSAEISADRAGLACAEHLEPAGRAMFKLTSGLAGDRIALDLGEFIRQAVDLAAAEPAPDREELRRDWLTTHPFSPLRVRALQLVKDAQGFGGARSLDEVDAEVAELLAIMEPRYTVEQSAEAEAMRRLLLAGGVAVAAASSDGVAAAELAALEQLLGAGNVPERPNVAALVASLEDRAARVVEAVAPLRRHQVLRDLCLIARADRRLDAAEIAQLETIAALIQVPPAAVHTALGDVQRELD